MSSQAGPPVKRHWQSVLSFANCKFINQLHRVLEPRPPGVEIWPFPLLSVLDFTTACATVQAVIQRCSCSMNSLTPHIKTDHNFQMTKLYFKNLYWTNACRWYNGCQRWQQCNVKLEALGQCIPPPRHVLPVPPSGKSVWAADLCPLTTFRISQ